jgi:hypothetical protein
LLFVSQKVVLKLFFIGQLPKPALLFVLIQKVSKKIKASFYLFLFRRGGCRNYFYLQICDPKGDFPPKVGNFPLGTPHFAS